MVVLGHVRNGIIVADDPVELPEGASVRIELLVDNPTYPQPQMGRGKEDSTLGESGWRPISTSGQVISRNPWV